MKKLPLEFISTINSALEKLTGFKRRAYAAEICIEYFESSPMKMERALNVGREMVKLGLSEYRSGIRCVDAYNMRGAKKKKRNITR